MDPRICCIIGQTSCYTEAGMSNSRNLVAGVLSSPFCLLLLRLWSDWPVRNPGVRGTMHCCPEAQLGGSNVWSPPSVVPGSVHSPAWSQLRQALVFTAPVSLELSPPVASTCTLPSSLMALCSHLPGLNCGEPRVHNHWILKGLALWF